MAAAAPLTAQNLPLRDIHLPAAVSWWPPAPGWWLLLLLVLLLAVLSWWILRRYRRARFRRLALRELDLIAQSGGTGQAAALSRLLRRAALCYYPAAECAGLCDEEWLIFLDQPFSDRPFSQGIGRLLLDAPYRPAAEIDAAALIALCRRWLQHLPLHRRRKGGVK